MAHGEDIAATFAEAAEGLNGRALLRERLDLASHALRLRLRIGATNPTGRMLAGAAPIVLATTAGSCLYFLLPNLHETAHRIRYPFPNLGLGHAVLSAVLVLADTLPWILALAVLGPWRGARITALVAVVVTAGLQTLSWSNVFSLVGLQAALILTGALVVLAPPDLVDVSPRRRREGAAVALAVGLPMIAMTGGEAGPFHVGGLNGMALLPIWQGAVVSTVLLARLAGRRPDRLGALGASLAVLPGLLPAVISSLAAPDRPLWIAKYAGSAPGGADAARPDSSSRRPGLPTYAPTSAGLVPEKCGHHRVQLTLAELRHGPALAPRVPDELGVEGHVVVLHVVGQVGMPEPVPVRHQVPPADHRPVGAEDVTHERGRGDQDRAVAQVLDEFTCMCLLMVADGRSE
ncbi:hypothetical protein [Kitasatospora sp. NPDC088346]|uniref:hypothetical protein n=1 Tax=Kitasatospora sp. NPDC088346 TaxID=3364073 RepID=UPI003805B6C4